jgi:copper chaperone CopZ
MKTTLEIQNLKCGGCAHTITTRLNELNKLDDIIVNPEVDTVSFSYNNQEAYDEVTTLLSKLGYPSLR